LALCVPLESTKIWMTITNMIVRIEALDSPNIVHDRSDRLGLSVVFVQVCRMSTTSRLSFPRRSNCSIWFMVFSLYPVNPLMLLSYRLLDLNHYCNLYHLFPYYLYYFSIQIIIIFISFISYSNYACVTFFLFLFLIIYY
jgi:hypothetical protein